MVKGAETEELLSKPWLEPRQLHTWLQVKPPRAARCLPKMTWITINRVRERIGKAWPVRCWQLLQWRRSLFNSLKPRWFRQPKLTSLIIWRLSKDCKGMSRRDWKLQVTNQVTLDSLIAELQKRPSKIWLAQISRRTLETRTSSASHLREKLAL